LAGGAAGLLLAIWGLDVLTAMNSLPRLRAAGLDSQMLATALVISGATTLCFGLAPAWRGARTRVQEVLVDGGLGATGGRKGVFFRDLLVVMQVAVAMVLLAGAGLMWASVSRILRIEPGFDPENLLTVEVQAPWRGTQKREDREKAKNLLVSQLLERLQVVPGVVAAGLQEQSFTQSFELDGKPDALRGQHVLAATGEGDVFKAMRMPLLDGRYFEATDNARPEVIIINETLARQAWPGESAIGKTLGRGDPTSPKFEVVGVVGDVRISGYLQAPTPTIYHPYLAPWSRTTLIGGAGAQFVIRTAVEPELLIPLVRNELKQAGSTLLTPSFRIASGVLHDSTLVQRTYRNYLGVFALLGLVLAALGVYGVLAFSVARRTREIGIRMAVGATGAQVCGMIMSRGGVLVAAGSLLGLGGVWALGKLLRSQLFGISPTDPGVLSGALLALLFSGLFACWLPARRAARVDPITALRTE
jgi:putative ABC transport system permease protein